MAPRVRFAPSPTGFFHVGSARTSLFNWLFARQSGGTFILRIEDTDVERNRDEWREGIISAMAWLGLDFDEGPYRQSELIGDHRAAADALLDAGYLYACDCTREAIDARTATRATPGYDGYCRDRGLARSATTALRFRMPAEGVTVVHDLIRGDVTFPHESYEDFVVVKSNGVVLYPLANAVDDRTMAITHVIRGEDLLPTTPKQVMLWEALNRCADEPVDLPLYAHLPMLVNEQRKKLSKRKDPVAVESYRDQGYLPEAFVNYLALLGWSPRDGEEIVSRAAMIEEFRLEDVAHSPAFFDVKKLTHMNGEYLRRLDGEEFVVRATPWVAPWDSAWRPSDRAPSWREDQFDAALFARVAPLVQERVATLGEVPGLVDFFFLDEVSLDETALAGVGGDALARDLLDAARERFATLEWTAAALHEATADLGETRGLALRRAQAPIRLAVTGRLIGPPLFESLEILGRERVLARLDRVRELVAR